MVSEDQKSQTKPEPTEYEQFNYVLGTQTFGIKYQFTSKSKLVETAEAILEMGSNILKCHLGRDVFIRQYSLFKSDDIKSLRDLVQKEPSFVKVLNMPFDFYMFWVYPFGPDKRYGEVWHGGLDSKEKRTEYQEVYDLACYLLKTFSGSGKKFYFGHWEGDWTMMDQPYDSKRDASPKNIQGMIDTLNIRQKAIEDAKKDTSHDKVEIYQYTEMNLARKAIAGGVTIANNVLPKVNVDYVSYSAYDSIDPYYDKSLLLRKRISKMSKHIKESLDYIESKLPKKDIPGKRVFIGEYGFPLQNVKSPETQDHASRAFARAAMEWGCPFVLYWEIYCNENSKGFWLIDDKGKKQPIYYTHQDFYKRAKQYVEAYRKKHKKNPTQEEFLKTAIDWL